MEIIEKIEALLRKAEGASTPEEAEAFYAGARRMMVKHAIDEAALQPNRDVRERPDKCRFQYSPNNYWLPGKRELLLAACEMAGSGTRFLYYSGSEPGPKVCEIIGFAVEREVAQSAYASLYLQARMGASSAGFTGKREVSSFMIGYARGVIHKVIDAQTTEEAKLSESTALALVDRSKEVEDLYNEQDARPGRPVATDVRARSAGFEAGREADLVTQGRLS